MRLVCVWVIYRERRPRLGLSACNQAQPGCHESKVLAWLEAKAHGPAAKCVYRERAAISLFDVPNYDAGLLTIAARPSTTNPALRTNSEPGG